MKMCLKKKLFITPINKNKNYTKNIIIIMNKLISPQFPLIPQIETCNPIQNIDDIFSDDLLIEILQRIPLIDVFRAKSVCKRWYSMISDPFFSSTYIHYHDKTRFSKPVTLVYQFMFWHRVLSEEPESKIHSFSDCPIFPTPDFQLGFLPCFRSWGRHRVWLTASYKDLLLCCDAKIASESNYYVCNPLTKQWVAVSSVAGHHSVADTAMGLIVSDNGGFRVVRILELDSNPNNSGFEVEVFCSQLGKWAKFTVTCSTSFNRTREFKPDAIVVKNKLHWLINGEIIVVFDPFKDDPSSCSVINLPSELNTRLSICLGSCRDRLKVFQLIGGYPNGKLVIWDFGDCYDDEKWVLEWNISVNEMRFSDNLYFNEFGNYKVEILGIHPSDSRILYMRIWNQIVRCNLGLKTLEVVSECLEYSAFSVGTCGVYLLTNPSWPSLL